MHDIRYIRENPDEFDRLLRRRGFVPPVDDIKELDQKRRSAQTEMQNAYKGMIPGGNIPGFDLSKFGL